MLLALWSVKCEFQSWRPDIVNTCPLTGFEGGLNLLHEADDDATIWLESVATAAFMK